MSFIAWPEIESFYHIRKYVLAHPEILNGNPVVSYRAKIKLHGTNSAIQCHSNGRVVAQSRTRDISVEDDNRGFAKWVKDNEVKWQDNKDNARSDVIIYGEWIGNNIQKGVAVSQIPNKSFAVFAARALEKGLPLKDHIYVDPDILQEMVADIPNAYVIPWYNDGIQIDWSKSSDDLNKDIEVINQWVAAIEANDPWVEAVFNIKGMGEGLVFYPMSDEHIGYESFKNLCFKAKGEKHKNIKSAKPAQAETPTAEGVIQFVDMVLTNARLEQGVTAVAGSLSFDMKLLGNFIKWIMADVEKETKDELVASNLEWKQVQKEISNRARLWYIEQFKARLK